MIKKDTLEKNYLSKEELKDFYNSQFETMEFPWLDDVKAWIEKTYDVKVMTILYEILDDGTHEFKIYFYSSEDSNKIPLVGGQVFWAGHCVEIENIISNYFECNGKIKCRLTYTNFKSSARKYLLSLSFRVLNEQITELFAYLNPIYTSVGQVMICVLETKEEAKSFLLDDNYKRIRQQIFDLIKPYDEYNILEKDDIKVFVDHKENKEKISMYGFWVQEMLDEDMEKYEKTLIDL